MTQNIFLSCPRHCDQGFSIVIVFIFKSETKKNAKSLLVELRGAFDKFPDVCRMVIWNCRRLLKIHYVNAIILWDDWPILMISASNEQLQQQLECTQLKPDCHRWWISKMQSGRDDTLEERYSIKFCFKLAKYATETYGMLQTAFRPSCMNRPSIFEWHKRFKEGKGSVRDDERCGRSKAVNRPGLIGQRIRVKVTMLSF